MREMEKTIWKAIEKCHLEPVFWRLTKVFPSTEGMVSVLYRRQEQKEKIQKIWCKRIGMVFLFLAVFLFLCYAGRGTSQKEKTIQNGNIISREGEGKNLTFDVWTQVDGTKKTETVTISLEDREFNREEFSVLNEKCLTYLNAQLKGQNPSLEMVSAPLNFVTNVPETGIEISWILAEDYVKDDGTLNLTEIPEEGVQTSVVAQAKWRNWEKEYTFPLTINGNALPEGERAMNQIKNVLFQKIEEQKSQKEIALPTKVGSYPVHYGEAEQEKKPPYYLLSGLVLLFLPVIWRKEERKKLEERQWQLKLDYPEFVNKTMLLFNAGLTVRGCFERLGDEYQYRLQKGGERRYVYEEVLTAYQEMTNGASEAASIEHFGKRCRQLCYLRYASIINQNMKKGTEGFIALLEAEAADAFEKRKEWSRQLGETAGTKLLLPMMLMFGIVIGIIIMPAFMAM